MTDRIKCVVPHCGRTKRVDNPDHDEWICGKHWTAVDRVLRRIYKRAVRRTPYRAKRLDRLWTMCKRQANERAAGI